MQGKNVPHKILDGIEHKYCATCGSWIPVTLFGKSRHPKDGLYHRCKQCVKKYLKKFKTENRDRYLEQSRRYRSKREKRWLDILAQENLLCCSVCGYEKCFAAIDYHHVDPSTKEEYISKMFERVPTPNRLLELKKCIPLCANCHREYHYNNSEVRRCVSA